MSKEDEIRERTAKLAVHLRQTIGAYYGEATDKDVGMPVGDILTALAALSGTLINTMPDDLRASAVRLHLEVFSNACGATVTPIHAPAQASAGVDKRLH